MNKRRRKKVCINSNVDIMKEYIATLKFTQNFMLLKKNGFKKLY